MVNQNPFSKQNQFVTGSRRCCVPQNWSQNQIKTASKLKVKFKGSGGILWLLAVEWNRPWLWPSEWQSPGSTGPPCCLDRRLPAGCRARRGHSPLISLEELWKCKCVMQKWVDGVAVRARALRGRMFACCVWDSVKQHDSRVGLCCVRMPKMRNPLVVSVCVGSYPSTVGPAPSRPLHHSLEEVTRWYVEPKCAQLCTRKPIKVSIWPTVFWPWPCTCLLLLFSENRLCMLSDGLLVLLCV